MVARAATPESVTVTPASGIIHYTSSLIGGVANDGSVCVEDVSCDTVGVVVAAGGYTGPHLRPPIDWLRPASPHRRARPRDLLRPLRVRGRVGRPRGRGLAPPAAGDARGIHALPERR